VTGEVSFLPDIRQKGRARWNARIGHSPVSTPVHQPVYLFDCRSFYLAIKTKPLINNYITLIFIYFQFSNSIMTGGLLGIALILIGLLLAPSGAYLLYVLYGLALLTGLYFGFQGAVAAPSIPMLDGIPLAQELIGALYAGAFGVAILGAIIGISIGLVPMAYGFQIGQDLFGESLLAFVPAFLAIGVVVLVVVAVFWVLSAILGGIIVSIGVQLIFSVVDEPTGPYTNIAETLESIGLPDAVPAAVEAVGAIGQSPLLLGITVVVTLLGTVGHPLVIMAIE
jgi:hypothetical protein